MKSFKCKITSSGNYEFVDQKDRASLKELLSFLHSKGVRKVVLSISEDKGITTQKQQKLWDTIKSFIRNESGNDVQTIEQSLNQSGKDVSKMSHQEFNDLLEDAFILCKDFFGLKLRLDDNGFIEKIDDK